MWDNWEILQPKKLSANLDIYIGCMTGTSADNTADFTAATFDTEGMPICFKNFPITIPEQLNLHLLTLSKANRTEILRTEANRLETQLTNFFVDAFLIVIKKLNLLHYPKTKIILSPHGQTLEHNPLDKNYYTDIIVNGPMLAQKTGYKVVTQHRQAPLVVSMAAPLAPVLIKKLFFDPQKNVVLINGGGIANITILNKNDPTKIIGYDTGPANAPIDSLIHYLLDQNLINVIPELLRKPISEHRFDVDGKLAESGAIIPKLYKALRAHEYFSRKVKAKSADRADFDIYTWILPQLKLLSLAHLSWIDIITTISAIVADSIADAINNSLTAITDNDSTTKVIFYGGMSHNQYIIHRIQTQLLEQAKFEFIDMRKLNYIADYFEALLMAYLGFCAHHKIAIDLNYCAREDVTHPFAIPGVVAFPAT